MDSAMMKKPAYLVFACKYRLTYPAGHNIEPPQFHQFTVQPWDSNRMSQNDCTYTKCLNWLYGDRSLSDAFSLTNILNYHDNKSVQMPNHFKPIFKSITVFVCELTACSTCLFSTDMCCCGNK